MKILYGIPGEGMGHATRSKVIIEHLLKSHDVQLVSSSRAFDFLNKQFPERAHKIDGFNFAYKDGEVKKLKTLQQILKTGAHDIISNVSVFKKLNKIFVPDIIITDFELSAFLYGKYLKIPIIDIDNIQVLSRCKIDITIPASEKTNYNIAKTICKLRVPGCDNYLLSSFFNPIVEKENTAIIPPILRNEIINAKPTNKGHIIVYQTSTSQKDIIDVFNTVGKETFLVYGFNKEAIIGNCLLKTFSEAGFIDDLASSKAVITNGGYSLISEAVYLKKPVCACPVHNQFEQFMNAAYIQKLGYGKHLESFEPNGIKAFMYDIDVYNKNLESYSQNGNIETFKMLDELLGEYAK